MVCSPSSHAKRKKYPITGSWFSASVRWTTSTSPIQIVRVARYWREGLTFNWVRGVNDNFLSWKELVSTCCSQYSMGRINFRLGWQYKMPQTHLFSFGSIITSSIAAVMSFFDQNQRTFTSASGWEVKVLISVTNPFQYSFIEFLLWRFKPLWLNK